MVRCPAYGCKNGYDSQRKQPDCKKVSFNLVPKDKELLDKWIRANPRKDWVPTKYTRMCSDHFTDEDFIIQRTDKSSRRRKKFVDQSLPNRRLKHDAVPSIFAEVPAYLTKKKTCRQTRRAAPSVRREEAERDMAVLTDSFIASDDISKEPLTVIAHKLRAEQTKPDGFNIVEVDDGLHIYLMSFKILPTVSASITVDKNYVCIVGLDGRVVPASQYKHILKGQLQLMSQLVNLMACVKNWHTC